MNKLILVALFTSLFAQLKSQNNNRSLFPLYGITPTVTTISEAIRLGATKSEDDSAYRIDNVTFWDNDNDGVIDGADIGSGSIPKVWKDKFGFSDSISYTLWVRLLLDLDFKTELKSVLNKCTSGLFVKKVELEATSYTEKTKLSFTFKDVSFRGVYDTTLINSIVVFKIKCSGIETGIYHAGRQNVKQRIEKFVNSKLQEWQKKGEFEKTADYLVRVSDENRKKKIITWQQEKMNDLIKEEAQNYEIDNFAIKEYDADNETYLLAGIDRNYVIKVPLTDAPTFKQKFESANISNRDFLLTDDGFKLSAFTVNVAGLKYSWSHTKDNPYQQTAINYNFDKAEISLPTTQVNSTQNNIEVKQINVGKSDVDLNIPSTNKVKSDAYVLAIGNEDYSTYQMGLEKEANVPFAANDAEVFAKYCEKTLGIPATNIVLLKNATLGQMGQAISKLEKLAEIGKGSAELIFYYAGHGLPNEETKQGYLIPVDVNGSNLTSGISLSDLYTRLGKFPTKKVTVLLDACFSGGSREGQLLALRSVRVKPKEEPISNNMVVFTSSSGNESSAAYEEKAHGMFTYYLLKKLMDTKGEVTYQELGNYIQKEVLKQSVLINNKEQNPQIKTGNIDAGIWSGWKF